MKLYPLFFRWFARSVFLFLFVSFSWGGTTQASAPVPNALGWVGNMFPAGGSANTITQGGSFNVYLQVWKDGTTNFPGQGTGITCTLYWGQVTAFGGSWSNVTSTPMSYNTDIGNNDEYVGTISPLTGLYEFTGYCTDIGDNQTLWQGSGNGQLTVNAPTNIPTGRRAFWVEEEAVAWNVSAASYELHYSVSGLSNVPASSGSGIPLTFDSFLTGSSYAKFPNLNGYEKWVIPAGTLPLIPTILKGDIALAAYNGSGNLVDSTRLQIQGVLDDLYSYSGALGVTYTGNIPTLRLWAPTATSVNLRRYADPTTPTFVTNGMTLDTVTGVWSIAGTAGWDKQYYLYEVTVWSPFAGISGQLVTNLVTDPYSLNLSMNSERSQILNLYDDPTLKPVGWDSFSKPPLTAPEDIAIYELHVRDFSIRDLTVTNATHRGTFEAFTYDGTGNPLSNGMSHLLNLQEAGLTHVHLMPAFDIASVNEDVTARTEPDWATLSSYAPNSDQQQSLIATYRADDGFNWGYDPYHYGAPEGSYATNPNNTSRVTEFREMVQTLNENGLRVVMDVVYNHTAASGQNSTSVLDKVVPGYYHRYNNNGDQANSSCCADTAAEFEMMEKLMIDTVLLWATAYKVDGFRFDLMNLHTVENMTNLRDEVQSLTVTTNGVNGEEIYLYGEGWSFGSALEKGLPYANQYNMAGTGIGTFNDKIRDAAHGGFDTNPLTIRRQGFINGQSYDWNGYLYTERFQGDLRYSADRLRFGLAGSLQNYMVLDQANSWRDGIGFNGTGYTTDPQETVNYVSKHDNETLFDLNAFKAPMGESGTAITSMQDRVRIQNLGLSIVGLSQGIPFFDLGSDMLRSKSLDRNSYDSGDWFNYVDFTYTDNNFGKGLPPAWDNSGRWSIMSPMLTNALFEPTTTDILSSTVHLQEILQIRQSSLLFRLPNADEIRARVHQYNTGSGQSDALIVMTLSDAIGADLDPDAEFVVVLFNANKVTQSYTLSHLAGTPFSLHPVQQAGADSRVKNATYNSGTGMFTVPARTTAVFLATTAPSSSSPIDWVGDMYPNGGQSSALPLGDGTGLTVYVQVFEPGVTGSANYSNGGRIGCALHWGEYGQSWSDLTMRFNPNFAGNATNDEYFVTIPTENVPAGTYGFTAYCSMDGGAGKTWRQLNDGGDGVLSILPPPSPDTADVFVHLFEWKWSDIANECENWLGPKGFDAVQVSPPQEHIDHRLITGFPWWARYQPVSYQLISRSGTMAEFQDMVNRCQAVGVDIIVDAVINHMTSGSGTGYGGTAYTKFSYPTVPYTVANFHTSCPLNDYSDRTEVQNCELLGLADLNLLDPDTQAKIQAYLNNLVNMGVAGFRIDGSKHLFTYDLTELLAGVNGNPYIFQEVIEAAGEPVQGFEYLLNGDVTEFDYSNQLGTAFSANAPCTGNLADLENFATSSAFMSSGHAVVFTDNHDNQRGHGTANPCIVTHQDGALYTLANVFMLAYPYGQVSLMSSYHFTNDDQGPPSDGSGNTSSVYTGSLPTGCNANDWVCEHRVTAMANMVRFREVTNGEPVTNWWGNGNDHIAFERDGKGFVAINREATSQMTTYQTSLPSGIYCNITKYNANGTGCYLPGSGTKAPVSSLIIVDANGQIVNQTVASMDSFAIHTQARIASNFGDIPLSYGLAWHVGSSASSYLGSGVITSTEIVTDDSTLDDDGVIRLGSWSVANGGVVQLTVHGGMDGYVAGWIDWNQDGDFLDADEQLFANELVLSGESRVIALAVPVEVDGQIFAARFRVYDSPQTVLLPPSPFGGAEGGEVEDYWWGFTPTLVTLRQVGMKVTGSWWWVVGGWLSAGTLLLLFIHRRRKTVSPSFQLGYEKRVKSEIL